MTRVGWRDVEGGAWKEGRGRRDVEGGTWDKKRRDGRGNKKTWAKWGFCETNTHTKFNTVGIVV